MQTWHVPVHFFKSGCGVLDSKASMPQLRFEPATLTNQNRTRCSGWVEPAASALETVAKTAQQLSYM